MFDIRWTSEQVDGSEVGNTGRVGVISLGDESESFQSLIGYWSPLDYQRHWESAVRRVVELGMPACLVTSVHDPAQAEVVHCWYMYPTGNDVVIRNALLLRSSTTEPFDTSAPHRFVPPYSEVNEDGGEISEWRVPLSALREFLR
jgi:hypothetical protein